MALVDFMGFAAGFLTTVALLPQVIKSWKTKHTGDVSLLWIATLTSGVFLWIIYGFLINSSPVLIANILTFVLCVTVLALKLKYNK